MYNLKLPQTTSGNTNTVCIFSFYCCLPLKVKPHGKFAVEHANLCRTNLRVWRVTRTNSKLGQIIKQQSLCGCCSYSNINRLNFDFPQYFIYLLEAFHMKLQCIEGTARRLRLRMRYPLNSDISVSFFIPRLLLRAITSIFS